MLVLLFDIDGTLISTGGAGGAALREAFRHEFQIAEPADVPFAGRTDRGIGSNLFREHQIEDTQEHWQRLRDGYLARLPFHLADRAGFVLGGVSALLDELARRERVAIGLLTGNTREGARIKLSYYHLFQHFAFGGFGDEHRDRDQVARAAMVAAHRHLNGEGGPQRVWVIGDTPLDVSCARAIQANVLAVATGVHKHEELGAAQPDALMNDLSDTERVLKVLS